MSNQKSRRGPGKILLTSCAALALSAGFSGTALAKVVVDGAATLDRPKVVQGYDGPVYVLIDFKAIHRDMEEGARPDLNLGLVLDRSGSMNGEGKMTFLKRAADLAVDQLQASDHLSVVEYDDQISVLWPSGPLENPSQVKSLIAGLSPRGSTNLTGGMMKGVSEVARSLDRLDSDDNVVSRVLLLSDGLANQGVTNPREIANLVREAKANGVRISTLGLGRDYDEDLMQLIAENGGGHYYYIENPQQIGRIFQEELRTLFQTVARDAKIRLETSKDVDGVEIVSFGDRALVSGGEVDLGDFYSEEERTLVLRIDPDDDAFDQRGTVDLGDISFSYLDVESGKVERVTFDLDVDVVRSAKKAEEAINKRVRVETLLLETERQHEDAVKLYEQGRYDEADKKLATLAAEAKDLGESYDDARLKQKAEALSVEQGQMREAASAPAASADYLKKSKQRLFKAQKGSRTLYALQEGDKGLEVERLQSMLEKSGDYTGPIDGVFDEEVRLAVEAYQAREGLAVDGVAGPATLSGLGLY